MTRLAMAVAGLLATSPAYGAGLGDYAAWKAANPQAEAKIADLKVKTAALIKADPTPPPTATVGAAYPDLAAKSRALSPEQKAKADALIQSGFIHWQSGDFAGAKSRFIDGLAIDPASGMGNFYLGDILDREGDKPAAAIAMDKARALAAGAPEAAKAAAALPALPLLVPEAPGLDKPTLIWRVPGAIASLWDGPDYPELLVIPAGEYTMGSPADEPGHEGTESPRHRVRIGYPLAVGKYPVTVGQYARFIADSGYDAGYQCQTFVAGKLDFVIGCDWKDPHFPQTDDSPVVAMNWHDAQAYVVWLSKKTGHAYRLLTEAEYEYVARGGTSTAFWWGDDGTQACDYVNAADLDAKAQPHLDYWDVIPCHDGHLFPTAVNSFKPNPFGLYGISGNTITWLQDCWTDSHVGAPADGSGAYDPNCFAPMVRGGSWADKASALRSAKRSWNIHNIRFTMNGFRVVRVL